MIPFEACREPVEVETDSPAPALGYFRRLVWKSNVVWHWRV